MESQIIKRELVTCDECEGHGTVIINSGKCGGCSECGSQEEKEVTCLKCNGVGLIEPDQE